MGFDPRFRPKLEPTPELTPELGSGPEFVNENPSNEAVLAPHLQILVCVGYFHNEGRNETAVSEIMSVVERDRLTVERDLEHLEKLGLIKSVGTHLSGANYELHYKLTTAGRDYVIDNNLLIEP
jgi:hypothetical protein